MLTLQDVASKLDAAKQAKQTEEKTWELCSRFLAGQQNFTYDRNLQSYTSGRQSSNLPQINLIMPLYRTVVSKLSTAYPGIAVLPATPSQIDIAKAKASEVALRYFWKSENVDRVLQTVIEYVVTFGNAGLFTYYNPDTQKICAKAISPFDMLYESGVCRLEDAQWVAIRQFIAKDELIEMYPDHTKMLEEYSTAYSTNWSQSTTDFNTSNYVPPGTVDVYEIYTKSGKMGICVNKEFLFESETPSKCWPIQHVKWCNVPNRLWGISLVAPIVEIQALYNKARGQVIQNVELMANPKWLIPKSAGVAPNAITKEAGEKIFYNPSGGTPQQIPAAPIPAYVIDNIRQLQTEMMDVSGLHSTTLGKRAVGIVSGKAIETLTAQDISSLATTQGDLEHAASEFAKCVLSYMKEYYTTPRNYRMFDELKGIIFKAIHSTDIVDTPEIFIQAGSLFQDNAQDREARAVQMLEMQLITKEDAIQMIDSRVSFDSVLKKLKGTLHANEMLEAMKKGAIVEFFATDDIEAVVKAIDEFMSTPEWYALEPERQDYIRDVLVSLSAPPGPEGDAAMEQAKMNSRVYPRRTNPRDAQTQIIGQGPTAATQTVQAATETAMLERAVRNTRPQEAAPNEAVVMGGGVRQ